jgi:hypothetical protein
MPSSGDRLFETGRGGFLILLPLCMDDGPRSTRLGAEEKGDAV